MSPLSQPPFCLTGVYSRALTFRETVGRTNYTELVHSFRNPLQLNWVCHLPLWSCSLHGNSFGTPIFPGLMRSPAPLLDSTGPWLKEVVPTNYLDLVATSSQPLWSCLLVIALWVHNRKERACHLTTFSEKKTLNNFLCKCLSLARCSPFLVGLTQQSRIDIKEIASFIKVSEWFFSVGKPDQFLPFFLFWLNLVSTRAEFYLLRHNGLLCVVADVSRMHSGLYADGFFGLLFNFLIKTTRFSFFAYFEGNALC